MKIDSVKWEKTKKRSLFYAWPMIISSAVIFFVLPFAVDNSLILYLLTPFLALLPFVPFTIVEVRRYKAEAAQEKRALQAKYDAEDEAMFGKPLREI